MFQDLFANLVIEDPKIGNVVIEDVDKVRTYIYLVSSVKSILTP